MSIALFTAESLLAHSAVSYGEGKALSQTLDQGLPQNATGDVPEYRGEAVPEKKYEENFHHMSEDATALTHGSEVGSYVLESQKTSRDHDYRVTEDHALVQSSNEVVADPMKYIGGTETKEGGGQKEIIQTTHVCLESGEAASYGCEQRRLVTLKERPLKTRQVFSHNEVTYRTFTDPYNYYGYGQNNFGNGYITRKIETPVYKTEAYKDPLTESDVIETIEDPCSGYEEEANKGLCIYGDEEILEGPETRRFCAPNGDCLHVTRDWWKRRRTYQCKYPSPDTCGALRTAGCDQVKAICLKRISDICVEHEKTFVCTSEKLSNGTTTIAGDVPFCLDGNCDDHSWTPNKDFAEAMSKLSVFQEMSKEMDASKTTAFRGNGKKCSKAVLGFQDCCGSGGWGRGVGLGQACSADEKDLKKERAANKCVRVGTYCSQKEPITGICLTKKTSFCCFGSKLSKLVQEQGRGQLGIGWGDAEHPNCRPLTIEEIQRIDFSRMDFSSLYSEIQAKTNITAVTQAATSLAPGWSAKINAASLTKSSKIQAAQFSKMPQKKKDSPERSSPAVLNAQPEEVPDVSF
jgi:hypothetical protein